MNDSTRYCDGRGTRRRHRHTRSRRYSREIGDAQPRWQLAAASASHARIGHSVATTADRNNPTEKAHP